MKTLNCYLCHRPEHEDHRVCDLLREAQNEINTVAAPENAIWRLVEAAGLLSRKFPDAEGLVSPTESGFFVIQDPTFEDINKKLNACGATWTPDVSGILYRHPETGISIALTEDGDAYAREGGDFIPVTDENTVLVIRGLRDEDRNTLAARRFFAQQAGGKNEILSFILRSHMAFNDGAPEDPVIRNEISFYKVGRNSTHTFYMGTKDGKRYRLSMYFDYYNEEKKSFLREEMQEIPNWDGYWGHH